MDRHLPNDIDNFFLEHFKNYAEEPEEDVWSGIEKRLTQAEVKKRFSIVQIISAACFITIFLLLSFLLVNPYHIYTFSEKISKSKIINQLVFENHKNAFVTSAQTKKANIINSNANETLNIQLPYSFQQHDFSIIKMPVLNNLNEYNNDKNLKASIYLTTQNLLNNELGLKEKSGAEKTASVVIKLLKKHAFVISPFFSFDHISGRFIEQYEFDNETKNDYSKRENPDLSFTGGVLAACQLNQKFSLLSGLSLSNSKISISSTAVSALKDATGVYKFKLATSYGLAEISNSGITPTEGDSLLISGASMQFSYVSFPVLISYKLNSKKIKLSVHSGLILNKLTSEKVETDYHVQSGDEAETINKIEGIRKTFFTLNAGIEAGYTITPHLNISVSPELRYGINSINKQTPIKTYPINYGVALHANIKLWQ
ncbi:MAG: hypothetical protein ABJA35_07520 [Parafilimonas sp.]